MFSTTQMKKIVCLILFFALSLVSSAQSGYEIKIDLKNYKDDLAYLTYYQFDKTFIKDTCTKIQNGKIIFKDNKKLDTGIYSLVSKQKALLFNFFVDNDTQKLELKSDSEADFAEDLVALNSEKQNNFLDYIRYIGKQNLKLLELEKNTILKTKTDTVLFNEKRVAIEKSIADYEKNFVSQNNGSYVASVVNLKTDKILQQVSFSSKGKLDSVAAFNYYKKHYWDGVNFKDDAIMRTPFFYNKVQKYFEHVVPMQPDSVSVAIDKILNQTDQKSLMYKTLLAHFTYTYESSTLMGFDKVFVYLVDNYFKKGKASGLYNDEVVVQNIIDRGDKLRPLLLGSQAPELFMIKAEDYTKMKALGFEDAKSSQELTKLYYKNLNEITNRYVKLSDVKAACTILVFWDADCSHCQTEIPVLLASYNDMLKENIDVKVFSVYTQYEVEKYIKYIKDYQLPWVNVYDGAHFNNIIQKYDVYSTPVIYLLDQNKVIQAKRIQASDVKSMIKTLEKKRK